MSAEPKSIKVWAAAAVAAGWAVLTASPAAADTPAEEAERIFKAAGVAGGLVVHVGCGDPGARGLTAAIGAREGVLVHGLGDDAADVAKARADLREAGLYGKVSVEQWRGPRLPYADNLVNLLVVSSAAPAVSKAERLRVLAPGGVACVRGEGGWTRTVKPRPDRIDEWTHYLHDASNNAVADDTVVGPPHCLQWKAEPLYARSHEIDSTISALVSAGGRLFYIVDEGLTGITDERLPQTWALIARDGFSGVRLWRRPVPDWGWPQWKREQLAGKDWTGLRGQRTRSPIVLPRRLVAAGERVYVTLGYRAAVTALDAATGKALRTYAGTEGTDEVLCRDGVLVLCVRRPQSPAKDEPAKPKKRGRRRNPPVPGVVMAVRADDGRTLWKTNPGRVLELSLTAEGRRVFYHTGDALVALDAESGRELWRTPNRTARSNLWGSSHTMLAHDGVVLIGTTGKLEAFDARTGKLLWSGRGLRRGCSNPPDLFVADGLVWPAGSTVGLGPRTGEAKRELNVPGTLITPGHHFRCYRGKATRRFILTAKRGVEFMDLQGQEHAKQDWLRAACKYGFVPCNGLLYMTPHQCFCYPAAKLNGFLAMGPRRNDVPPPSHPLERGPAYDESGRLKAESGGREAGLAGGAVLALAEARRAAKEAKHPSAENPQSTIRNPQSEDWSTFRHDPNRSGSTGAIASAKLQPAWRAELGGRLTQPTVADGRVFVACVHAHSVVALRAAEGKVLWRYTAGGRVDSPPTIHGGRVLFGSADGWVYCLRAADGALAWRFRAAPEARRIVDFDQVESAWPVHGSVLVMEGEPAPAGGAVAYCAAGRSSYLDGGIYVLGLDVQTGRVLCKTRVEGPRRPLEKDVGRPFDMEGARTDVLVTDGRFIYMRQIVMDRRLKLREAPRITKMGDRKLGRHLFSTAGLLDDSWWNRTFWMYSGRWPGYYIANQASKAGQILVFDDANTYGLKCYTRRNRHSPMFFPATKGYLLFADDNETEPALLAKGGKRQPVKWLPDVNKAIGWKLTTPAVDKDKGTGFTRTQPPKWAQWVPVRMRAMVLAGRTLFCAGPPDVLDSNDPLAAFQGRTGALLWAVSADDGKKLAELKLASPPVFDGLIAAAGRLFLATEDGRLTCLKPKGN